MKSKRGKGCSTSTLLLEAILEEQESAGTTTFASICNRDLRTFGKPGDAVRKDCQSARRNLLKLESRTPKKFLSLLQKHDLIKRYETKMQVVDDTAAAKSKSQSKMPAKEPAKPKATATADGGAKSSTNKEAFEASHVGKWITLSNGKDIYADRVEQVSVDPMDCGLNPYLDLVQHLEAVRFETDDAIVKAECFALQRSAELKDIELGLVSIRKTMIPNAVALTMPLLHASLRADAEETDQPDDQKRKLLAAARNFRMRNQKTKKMDSFWVTEAWETHETVLSKIQQSQAEDNKEFEVAMRCVLLVFPKHVEFDFKVCPVLEEANGTIKASSEGYKSGKQGICRLRWLLTTANTTVVRKKVKSKVVDDLADRVAAGFEIDDDEEEEGMDF